ncbi:MAG: NADH-quinone oxidoreductase subunit M, partial [Chloroflexaceae bacterium]|nr:NADH-quinone oxidoreductase subunit M [Chloroflexaceae bacterium]
SRDRDPDTPAPASDPGDRRRSAALTFFIYTMAGSLGLLLLFQFLYLATRAAGFPTFDLIALGRLGQGLGVDGLDTPLRDILFNYANQLGITGVLGGGPLLYSSIAFWAIFIAFAIKLAVWPFHTWLPAAYSEAPTAGSILLAAVMSKMGAYGMLRLLLPLVPDAAQYFAPVIGALALVGIVAGAFGALAHTGGDIKRLIGYTSINHMGYVALAVAAVAAVGAGVPDVSLQDSRASAINGAVLQMVAHGLSTGALFLLAGLLYQRTRTYHLGAFGGLRTVAPVFANVMGVAVFANLGLPGMAGFVGEFFIFRGAWATLPLFTLLATIGLVVTALALLLMYRRVFLGPLNERLAHTPDMHPTEFWTALPLLVLLVLLGIFPALIMGLTNTTALQVVQVFMQAFT